MSLPATIKKLDDTVVNRIAAGEVIQRPANAIKELLENSLDAQSSSINILLKGGGLKLLQIQDNGTGIRKDDLEIVCERFTTSKLRQFEDLTSISTFGFRGEALASVSHVAHLTITTKTQDEACAYRGKYEDGKLIGGIQPCAGNQGTTILAEDLFYNVSTRRKALKSPSDEHAKVSDVISKYAIHNPSVAFSLKKQGETTSDVKTPLNSTHVDNIRIIYGNNVARELVKVEATDTIFKFQLDGYISNANFSSKKHIFILFINNRLVDSQAMRKAIDSVYCMYLPKGSYPFVYLSLAIDPKNVDVNVHPTKHEVHFLHEEAVIENVRQEIIKKLTGANTSRTFYVQSKLPGVDVDLESEVLEKSLANAEKAYQNSMVRTDSSSQKLDKFFSPLRKSVTSSSQHKSDEINKHPEKSEEITSDGCKESASTSDIKKLMTPNYNNTGRPSRREIKLTSILTLRKEVESECNLALRTIIANHTFVGVASKGASLIQYETGLYCIQTPVLMEEYFYQAMLYDFGNLGILMLQKPLAVDKLLEIAFNSSNDTDLDDNDKSQLVSKFTRLLNSKAAMLQDYFSIEIDDGNLIAIPFLLDNYTPDLCELPFFMLGLAHEVNWSEEKACFRDICRQTAKFYSSLPDINEVEKTFKWVTEHISFPALKMSFLPSKKFADNGAILKIADLKTLYKIFERC